jgi:hypothetical protein
MPGGLNICINDQLGPALMSTLAAKWLMFADAEISIPTGQGIGLGIAAHTP